MRSPAVCSCDKVSGLLTIPKAQRQSYLQIWLGIKFDDNYQTHLQTSLDLENFESEMDSGAIHA